VYTGVDENVSVDTMVETTSAEYYYLQSINEVEVLIHKMKRDIAEGTKLHYSVVNIHSSVTLPHLDQLIANIEDLASQHSNVLMVLLGTAATSDTTVGGKQPYMNLA